MALKELGHYRQQCGKAEAHQEFRLLEKYFTNWNIYKLDQTKRRLNYNLAHHFRKQALMKKFVQALKVSNDLFNKVYAPPKIDMIYDQNLQNKAFQTLLEFTRYCQYKFSHLPQDPAFYFISNLWLDSYSPDVNHSKKGLRLQLNFHQKVSAVYLRRALAALQ